MCANYLVCLFICMCISMRILLANEQAMLWAAYLGCNELALHHGTSSQATIHHQGGMLKDAVIGYVSIQTICLSCGLISIGHGLSFTCFRWVLKGLLVIGATERITLPLGAVCHKNRACLGRLTILGDFWLGRYACWSVFQAGHPDFAVDLLYFVCNSTFGLYGFLYHFMLAWIVLFDPLLIMGMSMLRAAQKYVGI